LKQYYLNMNINYRQLTNRYKLFLFLWFISLESGNVQFFIIYWINYRYARLYRVYFLAFSVFCLHTVGRVNKEQTVLSRPERAW